MDTKKFLAKIQDIYDNDESVMIKDGSTKFHKHIIVENFAGLQSSTLQITKENEHALMTKFVAHRQWEIPVLTRWFSIAKLDEDFMKEAKYLDVLLYDKDFMLKK